MAELTSPSLRRFRDAVENDWPGPLELEEHSHAGMVNRDARGHHSPTS